MKKRIQKLLQDYIDIVGEPEAESELKDILLRKRLTEQTLTVISNEGIHYLPEELLRGEVFVVSHGNFDFSSPEVIKEQYKFALDKLSKKLRTNRWNKIFLVPFGHATLSMQIKLLIYRITGVETVDVFHLGGGKYFDFQLPQREIIAESAKNSDP